MSLYYAILSNQPFKNTELKYTPDIVRAVVQDEDDFGHEMHVLSILRMIPSVEIRHGGTYTDSVSGKPRQFDFRALIRSGRCRFRLAVECKRISAISPIVISSLTRPETEAFHDIIVSKAPCSGIGETFSAEPLSFVRRARRENAAYTTGDFVGKSMLRLNVRIEEGRKGEARRERAISVPDADVYERWSQALASAHGLCKSAAVDVWDVQFQMHHPVLSVVLPIVVLPNESLWVVKYDASGKIISEPSLTDECEFFVGRTLLVPRTQFEEQEINLSHIHFMTLKGFSSFTAFTQPQAMGTGLAFERKWFPQETVGNLS